MTCCPYGPLILIPLLFATLGTAGSLYAAFGCSFFNAPGVGGVDEKMKINYGLWMVQDVDGAKGTAAAGIAIEDIWIGSDTACILWEKSNAFSVQDDIDQPFYLARIFVLVGGILSILAWFWVLKGVFNTIDNKYMLAFVELCAAVFTGMSFWAMQSDLCPKGNCKLGFTGIICIVATIAWLITLCSSLAFLNHTYASDKE